MVKFYWKEFALLRVDLEGSTLERANSFQLELIKCFILFVLSNVLQAL